MFGCFPESLRKILTNFESLSQPVELVGTPDCPVHLNRFAKIAVRVFGAVCVGFQSFRVGFLLVLFGCFPESLRKILTNFESLSQPVELVGTPDCPVHLNRIAETVVRVFGAVCVGSQSFGVGFLLGLFFWISDSLKKVLKNFESLSQPAKLVEKPDYPVH